MSDFTVVRAASLTLRAILHAAITDDGDPLLNGVPIDLRSPRDMQDANQTTGVSLWLYRVGRQPDLLNATPPRPAPDQWPWPPFPLELGYLVTPVSADAETRHVLLGRAIQALGDAGSIKGATLQDTLAGSDAQLRVYFDADPDPDLLTIWHALHLPYQVGVAYAVQYVAIDSDRQPRRSGAVLRRESTLRPGGRGDAVTTGWLLADRTTVLQALVVGRATDAAGRALSGVSVRCDRLGTSVQAAADGVFGVTGDPDQVFPQLSSTADSLDCTVTVDGRDPVTVTATIPRAATFPVQLGDIVVLAPAATLAGRVTRRGAAATPLAGATVRCVTDAAVPGLHPLALRLPLVHGYAVATASVRAATVTPVGADLTCPPGARAGQRLLALSSVAGIGPGIVLRIAAGPREQYVQVAAIASGQVLLEVVLSATVGPGADVAPDGVSLVGPAVALVAPVAPGDGLLRLIADLAADVVQLHDSSSGAEELVAVGAVTDPAGFYQLTGARAVTRAAVKATATGLAASQAPIVWVVDDSVRPNVTDLGVAP